MTSLRRRTLWLVMVLLLLGILLLGTNYITLVRVFSLLSLQQKTEDLLPLFNLFGVKSFEN